MRASESVLRSFYESAPMGLAVAEVSGDEVRIISASATLIRLLGRPGEEGRRERPAGEPDIPAELTRRWLDAYRQARGSGHTAHFELTEETADGPGWFAFTVSPIADEPEGRPRFCVVVEDITASERVKRALRDSEEQVRLLLDSTGEAICGVDLDGRCTFCNTACLRLLGYSDTRDLLGKNLHGQIHHSRADGGGKAGESGTGPILDLHPGEAF